MTRQQRPGVTPVTLWDNDPELPRRQVPPQPARERDRGPDETHATPWAADRGTLRRVRDALAGAQGRRQ